MYIFNCLLAKTDKIVIIIWFGQKCNIILTRKQVNSNPEAFLESGSQADREKLQNTLDSLTMWAEEWGMKFNIPKCKIMHIGHKNPRYDSTMAGEGLTVVEEEKDIGVTVSSSLKPSKHCQKVAATANSVLRQLTKNFHNRDRHV